MRIATAAAFILALTGAAEAAEVTATSRIDGVVVFPQGAEVTRVAKVKLDTGEHTIVFDDLPAQAISNSIRIDGKANGKLEIGSVDSRRLFVPRAAAEGERRRLDDEIERLKDERSVLEGRVAAAETQKTLIANLAELPVRQPQPQAPASGIMREDWGQLLGLIGTSMAEAQRALVEAQARVRDSDRNIQELQKRLASLAPPREERTEVRVFVNAGGPLEADLTVSYQVGRASWSALYDARLTTGSKTVAPKLALTRRAAITQRTGESWTDAAVTLSTTRPTAGASAPDIRTVIVDFQPEPKPKLSAAPPPAPAAVRGRMPTDGLATEEMAAAAQVEAPPELALLDRKADMTQATVEAAPFQVLFNIPGRQTIPDTGEVKRVQLAEESIEPQLLVRTVPKLDAKAYLYAKLVLPKASVALLPGSVSLFRDGTFVGGGRLPLLASGEEHELGFGGDDLVRVRHTVADEKRAETGLISSALTDQRSYRITVKNMHERGVMLVVLDHIPVSQNQDIKVELSGRSAPTKRDVDEKRGVLAWEAKLEPDEERVIEFGYRVTWPAQRGIVYGR